MSKQVTFKFEAAPNVVGSNDTDVFSRLVVRPKAPEYTNANQQYQIPKYQKGSNEVFPSAKADNTRQVKDWSSFQCSQHRKEKKSAEEKVERSGSCHDDVLPQDGGWGWVVVAGCFIINAIVNGFIFSFGVLFIQLLEYFNESRSKTWMVGSVLAGTHLIFGPLGSALVNMWSCRTVAIIGTLTSFAAFSLSIFSPNIVVLVFVFGLVGGSGLCLINIATSIIVGFYFGKRRALANGISWSGMGLGTCVVSYLITFLVREYCWHGAVLIMAAVMLHCALAAMLFRPLHFHSIIPIASIDQECLQRRRSFSDMRSSKLSTAHSSSVRSSLSSPMICTSRSGVATPKFTPSVQGDLSHDHSILQRPIYRKDIFYSGSVLKARNVQVEQKNVCEMVRSGDEEPQQQQRSYFYDALKTLIGVSLLKNPVFILITVHSCLWTTQFNYVVMLPDYAIGAGYSHFDASFLLSAVGISSIFGPILSGWLADRPYIDVVWVNMGALLIGSAVCFLTCSTTDWTFLVILSCLFGLCMGTWVPLRAIIIVDLLGIDQLTNAFGLLAMFQGVCSCIGPPICGLLEDITHSYKVAFWVAGLAFLAAAILCLPMRTLSNNYYASHPDPHHNPHQHTRTSHPDAKTMHDDTPTPHLGVRPSHPYAEYSHPDTWSSHPDTWSSHPDTGSWHPDTGSSHPDTGSSHPDTGCSYLDTGSSHSDTGPSHPDTGLSRPDTGSSHPDTGSSHPDTGCSYLDTGSLHSDTGPSHPDRGLSRPDKEYSYPDKKLSHPGTESSHPEYGEKTPLLTQRKHSSN